MSPNYCLPCPPGGDFCLVRTSLIRETPVKDWPSTASSRDTYELAKRLIPEDADKEYCYALYLDGKHHVMAATCVSVGTMTASLVHPREVFRPAIALGAVAVILVHNHPSGDQTPSPEDVEITQRMAQVGHFVGIRLLDHVVIGEDGFASLLERGVIH